MNTEKTLLDKVANALLDKADDCFDAAYTQHEVDTQCDIAARQLDNADGQNANRENQREITIRQHEGADKLGASADIIRALDHALSDDTLEIKSDVEWVAGRNR